MTSKVLNEDNRFRVEWQGYSTDWLPDTPANRKAILLHALSALFGGNKNAKMADSKFLLCAEIQIYLHGLRNAALIGFLTFLIIS